MATSSLALTYADLYSRVGFFLGYGRDTISPTPAKWTSDQIKDIAESIKIGLHRFYHGPHTVGSRGEVINHPWSFLKPTVDFTLWSPIAVGSATVTGGAYSGGKTTLTVTGGTPFLDSMLGRTIVVTGVGSFVINTVTSTTVVSVTGDASTAVAATFAIDSGGDYTLPSDFGGLAGPITQEANKGRTAIALVGEAEILDRRSFEYSSGTPLRGAIRPRAHDSLTQQRSELIIWPAASMDYPVKLRYAVQAVTPDTAGDYATYPYGGAQHGETICECCLAAAEKHINGLPEGPRAAEAARMLAGAISIDIANHVPDYMDEDRSPAGQWPLGREPVTYAGVHYGD